MDKFNYLRSLLEKEAYEAIAGLTLSAENYKEAVAILKRRFGDKQQIISKHMDALLHAEAVTSPRNLKGLWHLYDKVESHIQSLKTLGVEADSYGSLLSPVLLTKLPQDLRLIISRQMSGELKLGDLLKMVEDELAAREQMGMNSNPTQPQQTKGSTPHTAATLLSSTPSSSPVCCFYQQPGHSATSCQIVCQTTARKQILRKSGRCFRCLRKGHIGRNCLSNSRCSKCSGRHHTSICDKDQEGSSQSQNSQTSPGLQMPASSLNPGAAPYATQVSAATNFSEANQKAVLLQTARTRALNPRQPQHSTEVRILMDSGSQRSYISKSVQLQLSLEPVREQQLSIATFGADRALPKTCPVVEVGLVLRDGTTLLVSPFVIPTICEPLVGQPISTCIDSYPHLAALDLADFATGDTPMKVDILIGCDYFWQLATGDICRGSSGPIAINTRLGRVLSGPTKSLDAADCTTNLVTTHVLRIDFQETKPKKLDEELRSFWELESLGLHGSDRSFYEAFISESITFQDGRYKISLPWKEVHDPLPDNYQLCLRRLRGLLCRLKQDPEILQEYDATIQDQIREGIVEVVEQSAEEQAEMTHYLPHHAVVRRDKATTKVRVVYDASARSKGPSLNDCLYKGPKFDQRILDLLVRFHAHHIALTADIEKAFLMVAVAEKDRDVLRFLWVRDIGQEPPEICILRFTRVVFGVSASPFLLNATISYHLEQYSKTEATLVQKLKQSTYVDDIVSGAESEEAAFEFYLKSKNIL